MNNFFEYTFFSEKIPNRMTLHSVVTHFLGKKESLFIDFKVFFEGKNIKIVTDKNINNHDFFIKLKNANGVEFNCFIIDKKEKCLSPLENDQFVDISGLIEYGINQTNKKGKKCPFYLGKFESNELRIKFKEHIEKSLGVEICNMEHKFFSRQISERNLKKCQFNNIILIESLPVKIVNKELFNKVFYKSYFQKKTYGFGNLQITKIY